MEHIFNYNGFEVHSLLTMDFRGIKYEIEPNICRCWKSIGFVDNSDALQLSSNWRHWLQSGINGTQLSTPERFTYKVYDTPQLPEYTGYYYMRLNGIMGETYKLFINGILIRSEELKAGLEYQPKYGPRCYHLNLNFYQPIQADFTIVPENGEFVITPDIIHGGGNYRYTFGNYFMLGMEAFVEWYDLDQIIVPPGTHNITIQSLNDLGYETYTITV